MRKDRSDKAQVISDMVEQMYPNVSKAEKERIAKTLHKQLSDGAVSEIEKRMDDTEEEPQTPPKEKGWWDNA